MRAFNPFCIDEICYKIAGTSVYIAADPYDVLIPKIVASLLDEYPGFNKACRIVVSAGALKRFIALRNAIKDIEHDVIKRHRDIFISRLKRYKNIYIGKFTSKELIMSEDLDMPFLESIRNVGRIKIIPPRGSKPYFELFPRRDEVLICRGVDAQIVISVLQKLAEEYYELLGTRLRALD